MQYDAGIQTFDTANVYFNGLSEVILGKIIKQLSLPRTEIVVLTKACPPSFLEMRACTNHIFESVKASLKRLQLDYIDVLQCHRFDYETPIGETMQALHDVVQVGYPGVTPPRAHQMQYYAVANRFTPFISMQNHSLLYREEEPGMFPTLKLFGVGAIPWSPLARGLLTRPLCEQTKRSETDRSISRYSKATGTATILVSGMHPSLPSLRTSIDTAYSVEELATEKGLSMAQVEVALAWSLAKEGVTVPIVGTTSLENLEEFTAASMQLSEEVKFLEEVYVPQAVIGHL
ncbi:hypothetical protein DXG01_006849 [Tephrocybe rancida]|nr:hypothetical protein DXG01_006849 [Tephrocybe rancida]